MSGERILIVDDEHDFVSFLAKCLQNMGYVVADIATTGETAVEKARSTNPDLILMDISLAGDMDGIQAAEAIRSQLRLPVVFLTGLDDEKSIQRAKLSEPLGYLLKPFKPRELKTTIDTALFTYKANRRREVEAGLLASEKYRALFENATEGIFQATRAGDLIAANPAAFRMLGFESEREILDSGVNLQTLLKVSAEQESEIKRTLDDKGLVKGFQLGVQRKDGRRIVLAMNLIRAPVMGDIEGTLGILGVFSEVTEGKLVGDGGAGPKHRTRHIRKTEAAGQSGGDAAADSDAQSHDDCRMAFAPKIALGELPNPNPVINRFSHRARMGKSIRNRLRRSKMRLTPPMEIEVPLAMESNR